MRHGERRDINLNWSADKIRAELERDADIADTQADTILPKTPQERPTPQNGK